MQRCRDTAEDDRGFMIALDDDDLGHLIGERKALPSGRLRLLKERFDRLVM